MIDNPSEETKQAMEDARNGLVEKTTLDELFTRLAGDIAYDDAVVLMAPFGLADDDIEQLLCACSLQKMTLAAKVKEILQNHCNWIRSLEVF